MKSDWYCTFETVTIANDLKRQVVTIKVDSQQKIWCGIKMHKLAKSKWANEVWFKSTCRATLIQTFSFDTIILYTISNDTTNIKLLNHLKATNFSYYFIASEDIHCCSGVKSMKTRLLSGYSYVEFFLYKNHWFKFLLAIMTIQLEHITVHNVKRINLSCRCLSTVEDVSFMHLKKTFIAASQQVTLCKKILFLCLLSFFCVFFVFVSWSAETTTAYLQGLTYLTHSKSMN